MAEEKESRLDELRRLKAAREAKQRDEDDAKEVALLELEEKFSGELGRKGVDFDIIDTVEGPIVIKRVPMLVLKQWDDAMSALGKKNPDVHLLYKFTSAGIAHPTKEEYKTMLLGDGSRAGAPDIATNVALALRRIHGSKLLEDMGK